MLDVSGLRAAYKRYGFEEARSGNNNVLVFTLKAGHFHNADIVPINQQGTYQQEMIFLQFKDSGFACKIRTYNDIDDVKKSLFQGFFSIDSTHKRLLKEYNKFTKSIISVHSDNAEYKYINSNYYINEKAGENDVISEITTRIDDNTPTLFLIEAAAGFGKTCTAFELLRELTENHINKVPLFTELSRNRQAKIFRYVLLDEIDRSFPLLSSALVRAEIRNGNVPVILDGFDELLHQSEDSAVFDTSEPMLETISELLTNSAKVILTTRRTSILDGDDFHEWMARHSAEFNVVRIRIENPTIDNWLSSDRLDILRKNNFPIEKLCNPVLLSYLRCIPYEEFSDAVKSQDSLVDKYFMSMLERERTRQDLFMSPAEQYGVLKYISSDMMEYDYTAESKDYITTIVQDYFKNGELEKIRKLYPVDERPTSDEIINKLTSHALLDRSVDVSSNIGFVNEFVLGNFCSDVILENESNDWCGNKTFIEPVTLSYLPRTKEKKETLWNSLKFAIEFVSASDKFINSIRLNDAMLMDIDSENIDNLKLKDIKLFDKSAIKNSVFSDCNFHEVIFFCDNMEEISFVNCNFFDCSFENENSSSNKKIFIFGCIDNNDSLKQLEENTETIALQNESDEYTACDIYVLEKFWPIGNPSIFKHRPAKALYMKNNNFSYQEAISSIEKLKKKRIILNADKNGILEFNMDNFIEIKSLLGR
ncbi:NACHT domain-containing protein [Pantoea agglomerans]